MKALFNFLAVLTVLAFASAPGLVRAQDAPPPPPPPDQGDQSDQGASFQSFYDQLGDQGNWVQTDNYGYAFQPNVSDPNWAPYTDGHWVYTDVGWTWVSDEPWGWATYHYGRWANIDGTGWVWIPGYRWAPAWVSWRYGGGYCGWAPLPPETFMGAEFGEPGIAVGVGFHFGGDVDVNFNIGPGFYNFVRVGDMGERNYRGHFIDRSRNYTVITTTTNITNINITHGGTGANFQGVVAKGPLLSEVNAHSHQRIPTVQLTAANQPGQSQLHGNSLAVYAPRVNAASIKDARPSRVSQTIANPTFNRGDSITRPLAVNATVKPPSPSAAAIQAATTAQAHAPAKARIATEQTTVKTPLNKPLTSLAPVSQERRTTNAVNSNTPAVQHSTASSPFTGESVKPSTGTENKPATTYHPEKEVTPQTENKPATTYHPEKEVTPQTENKPATTYHPEKEVTPQTENKPATTYHSQGQGNGGGGPVHTESAPAKKPAATGGQGNKPTGGNEKKAADDKNKQQGQ